MSRPDWPRATGSTRSIRGGCWSAAHRQHRDAAGWRADTTPTSFATLGALSRVPAAWASSIHWGPRRELSPFGNKAGAASALVGFWQMLNGRHRKSGSRRRFSHEACFALVWCCTVFSLAGSRALCDAGRRRLASPALIESVDLILPAGRERTCAIKRLRSAGRSKFEAEALSLPRSLACRRQTDQVHFCTRGVPPLPMFGARPQMLATSSHSPCSQRTPKARRVILRKKQPSSPIGPGN